MIGPIRVEPPLPSRATSLAGDDLHLFHQHRLTATSDSHDGALAVLVGLRPGGDLRFTSLYTSPTTVPTFFLEPTTQRK